MQLLRSSGDAYCAVPQNDLEMSRDFESRRWGPFSSSGEYSESELLRRFSSRGLGS